MVFHVLPGSYCNARPTYMDHSTSQSFFYIPGTGWAIGPNYCENTAVSIELCDYTSVGAELCDENAWRTETYENNAASVFYFCADYALRAEPL